MCVCDSMDVVIVPVVVLRMTRLLYVLSQLRPEVLTHPVPVWANYKMWA